MRMSDWSSDVCSSDLLDPASLPSFLLHFLPRGLDQTEPLGRPLAAPGLVILGKQGAMEFLEHIDNSLIALVASRSEEHTSELQSLMRISYAVFCLKKKQIKQQQVQLLL